jgi:hypothetical protein
MAKNNTTNYYFTQETEDAIVTYNTSSDPVLRDRIFSEKIYFPFYKLVENIIHTFKFYYLDEDSIEDLKLSVISMLVEEKIHKYDPSLGYKAYSYFGTIVKRWLINYNNTNYKKVKQEYITDEDSLEESSSEDPFTSQIPLGKVVDDFIENSYLNLYTLFQKEEEQVVADAILTLFKSRHDLEIFKKKAIYIYIREMTDCATPTVTKVINILKSEFYKTSESYLRRGFEINSL